MGIDSKTLRPDIRERIGESIGTKKARKKRGEGEHAKRKALLLTLKEGVESRPGYLRAVVPVVTVTEKNNSEHWRIKQKRVKAQEYAVACTIVNKSLLPPLPATVTFKRYGKRRLDNDNAVGAVSHIRDYIAKFYGVNDGHNSPLQFETHVEDTPVGDYFVEIEITSTKEGV